MIRLPIEIKSCSNHLLIRQVIQLRWEIKFFGFGFAVLCGGCHKWGCFCVFGELYPALGANPMSQFFSSKFFWNLGCNQRL